MPSRVCHIDNEELARVIVSSCEVTTGDVPEWTVNRKGLSIEQSPFRVAMDAYTFHITPVLRSWKDEMILYREGWPWSRKDMK